MLPLLNDTTNDDEFKEQANKHDFFKIHKPDLGFGKNTQIYNIDTDSRIKKKPIRRKWWVVSGEWERKTIKNHLEKHSQKSHKYNKYCHHLKINSL